MIAGYAFRSLSLTDGGVLLSDGLVIKREGAHIAGVGEIYDRIHIELIGKMKEMRMVSWFPFCYQLPTKGLTKK